jgi:hypothetical protein
VDGIAAVPLLMVVDPIARLADAESVRIARDVLRAWTPGFKLCLPDDPEEAPRLLARRGGRRPVLAGNDRALLRTVRHLHRERVLEETALSVVPVGNGPAVALARGLGLPVNAVSAARTVLRGNACPMDLLVDDEGHVVLRALRVLRTEAGAAPGRDVPSGDASSPSALTSAPGAPPWRRMCHALARTMLPTGRREEDSEAEAAQVPEAAMTAPVSRRPQARTVQRLLVEADGAVVAGPDRPLTDVTVRTTGVDGLAEVSVHPLAGAPVRVRARTVTVSAPEGFRCRVDGDAVLAAGPAESRTWTVSPRAWQLVLPAG